IGNYYNNTCCKTWLYLQKQLYLFYIIKENYTLDIYHVIWNNDFVYISYILPCISELNCGINLCIQFIGLLLQYHLIAANISLAIRTGKKSLIKTVFPA